MTDETLDGVFINPGFFGMCNKCFTAVMRVMRRDTEGLNSLIKVASIEFIAGVAIRTISAGKIEWICKTEKSKWRISHRDRPADHVGPADETHQAGTLGDRVRQELDLTKENYYV